MAQPFPDLSIDALFSLIWRRRRFLGILAVITAIVASVISLLITEYYRSTVVIFPARTNSLTLNESNVRRGNISDFGEEEEAEQLLQVLHSEELFERVVERNNLYTHYKIKTNDRYARSKVRQKYRGNVSVKRTKYNSIDISVVDADPIKAADIANSIAEFTDSVKNRMIRDRAKTSMSMLWEEEQRLTSSLGSVTEDLDQLQAMGVVGELERAGIYEALGEIVRNGDRQLISEFRQQIEINKKYGDEYDTKRRQREILTDQVMRFNSYKNQFIADTSINIPQKFVVDKAIPADKKSYPIRWLVVAGALFAVLTFSIILLIFQENAMYIFSDKPS